MTVHSCGYLVESNWIWFLRKTGFRLQNVSVHLVIGDIYCLLTNNIKIINIKVRLTNVNKDGQVKVNWKSEIFATQKFEISGPTTALERIWVIFSKSGRAEVRRFLGIKDFYMTVHFHPFSEWHFENFLKFGLNSYVPLDIFWFLSDWLVDLGPRGLFNWLERQTSRSQFWVVHELDISYVPSIYFYFCPTDW